MRLSYRTIFLVMAGSLLALAGARMASAQARGVRARITEAIDETNLVRLRGNVHPLARPEFDQGVVADSQPMNRMLLLLQRSPEQQAALSSLMEEQLTKNSPNFHKWLMPDEFGKQFGPSDEDIQAVTAWLGSHGFQGMKVAKGRRTIEFSGNAAQVRNAFHTEMHRFAAKGEEHVANMSDPQIPAALAPVVAGIVSLHDFRKQAHVHRVGTFRRVKATGELKPLFTFTPNGSAQQFAVGPPDFATIYDVPNGEVPLNGRPQLDGMGQTIAIVGRTNINLQDVADFRNLFGLPVNPPHVILNGPDPGNAGGGEELEADLDVQWSGAVAPNATIDFVVTETPQTNASDGADLSALYIVDNNLAPVMSESFGSCELAQGTAGNQFQNALWEQAAAQGISVTVATGDNGSADCDGGTETSAAQGLAVSGTASTPFNVAVGGTDFDDVSNKSTFWQTTTTTSTAPVKASAKGYIPETTWNDSCAANGLTSCTTVNSNGNDLVAGSGGPSNCTTPSGATPSTCSGAYAKPAYQKLAIPGIPNDTVRDIPDVSLFASDGNHGSAYIVCQADTNPAGQTGSCNLNSPFQDFVLVGGTSGSTPSFAGILALVNQKTGQRQGNANAVLYQLATAEAPSLANCVSSNRTTPATPSPSVCVFNDITNKATKSTISVACTAGSPNCSNTGNSGFGVLVDPKNKSSEAWNAGVGYDLATGLGSVDVTNLLNSWGSISRTNPAVTLTSSTAFPIAHGALASFTVTVSGSATGDVSLIAQPSGFPQVAIGPFTLNGGTITFSTNLLPGGTYPVIASYGGSATLAPSNSAPVNVTVGTEPSKTALSLVTFDANNNPIFHPNGANVAYGSPYVLRVDVTNNAGTQCAATALIAVPTIPCPTGNVSLTDNGKPLNDFDRTKSANLNNQGFLEDQPVQLPAGMHALVATYAGDDSFTGSTSPTNTVTITQAGTTTAVTASPSSITSGAMVTLTATVSTQSSGAAPGAPGGVLQSTPVQFLNGSTPITGTITLKPTPGPSVNASLTATLTTTISALGLPESPSPWRPRVPPGTYWLLAACAAMYAIFLSKVPSRRRRGYAYAGLVLFAVTAAGFAGCGGGGGKGTPAPRTVTITAKFAGDTNYTASSGTATVSVQ